MSSSETSDEEIEIGLENDDPKKAIASKDQSKHRMSSSDTSDEEIEIGLENDDPNAQRFSLGTSGAGSAQGGGRSWLGEGVAGGGVALARKGGNSLRVDGKDDMTCEDLSDVDEGGFKQVMLKTQLAEPSVAVKAPLASNGDVLVCGAAEESSSDDDGAVEAIVAASTAKSAQVNVGPASAVAKPAFGKGTDDGLQKWVEKARADSGGSLEEDDELEQLEEIGVKRAPARPLATAPSSVSQAPPPAKVPQTKATPVAANLLDLMGSAVESVEEARKLPSDAIEDELDDAGRTDAAGGAKNTLATAPAGGASAGVASSVHAAFGSGGQTGSASHGGDNGGADAGETSSSFASGAVAGLIGGSHPAPKGGASSGGPRPVARHKASVGFSRTDVLDEALKRNATASGSTAKSSSASGSAANPLPLGGNFGGSTLSSLRKNYDPAKKHPTGDPAKLAVPDAAASAGKTAAGSTDELDEADAESQPLLGAKPGEESSPEAHAAAGNEEELEAEWQEIGKQTDGMRQKEEANRKNGVVKVEDDITMKPISYKEIEKWFKESRIDESVLQPLRDEDVPQAGCTCFGGVRKKSDVPGLDRRHTQEKDLILYFSLCPFDFNEIPHVRMLRTMYLKLTRNKSCPSIGGHWQQIGFQAGDPRTDLNRRGNVLNVMHMFYFFSHYFDLYKEAYLLAQDVEQNYPLACVSINITGFVMDKFIGGQLSTLCNRNGENGVFEMICKIHSGALYYFSKQWRTQKRTIGDTEKTFKEVQSLLQSRPKSLLDELTNAVEERKAKSCGAHLEYSDIEFGTARRPAPPPQGAAAKAKAKAGGAAPLIPKRLENYAAAGGDA